MKNKITKRSNKLLSKFKTILSIIAVIALTISTGVKAETVKPLDLPNISVIGNMLGTYSDDEKTFNLKTIEFAFQHYLYPSVKVDIFTGLHLEGGENAFELCEGYVTFLDPIGLLVPNSDLNLGLGTIVGRKFLNIGKINQLHSEQWDYVNRPLFAQTFLGGEEGVSGEGILLSYLLPVPFFSQLEIGGWSPVVHAHGNEGDEEESGHDHHEIESIEYQNRIVTGRIWNSFEISPTTELEIGGSLLLGNITAESANQQTLMGGDITLRHEIGLNQAIRLNSELYNAKYADEGENKENQLGGFVNLQYKLNNFYKFGVRYDLLGKHGDEGESKNQIAVMATRQLTETSKFRIQYNTGKEMDNTIYAQFIFGMGPHSHILQ